MAQNRPAANWSPAVQVTVDEHEYVIQACLPRWMDDGVQVILEPGVVSLRAEAHAGHERSNGSVLQLERASDVFERVFRLPSDADAAHATAELQSGRLCVHLPRRAGQRVVPV